jgi:hypothetical protein
MHGHQIIEDDFRAQLLEHHIQVAGLSHLGEVSSGSLCIRTWITINPLEKIKHFDEILLDDFSANPYPKDMKNILNSISEVE